jgi:sec-independent protein translocase protein TatA
MGLDNPIHIAFLLVILLLVFGAKRLPEMGHSLGHGLRGFKDALTGDRSSEQHHDLPAAPVSVLAEEQRDVQPTPTSSAV